MKHLEKLLSISSGALASAPDTAPNILKAYNLGPELFQLLQLKNGFYAFEQALHVFPISADPVMSLEAWNSPSPWRNEYQDLADGLLFFAEDIFQDQFCLAEKGVMRFKSEVGETELMADSLEKWAGMILSDYEVETGYPLAHEWQTKNGPLPPGKRLMPEIPFFLGGKYDLENLWAGDAIEGMRFKADVAIQTRNLPDGAQVKFKFRPKTGSPSI